MNLKKIRKLKNINGFVMIFISLLILIVVIAIKSIYKQFSPTIIVRITGLIFIYAGALSLNALYFQYLGSGIGIYAGLFEISTVSQLFDLFLFSIAALILVSWPTLNIHRLATSSLSASRQIEDQAEIKSLNFIINKEAIQYCLIIIFSIIGSSLLISSCDLISMYLSIELQSFGLYILSTIYRNSQSATNAGLKYFLLGCLASCLILLGSSLVYSYTGLTNFDSLISLLSYNNEEISYGFGFLIIFIGFLFKIAAAPLHQWSPSVYDESPTIVTIWLTIMPKISIVIFLLSIFIMVTGQFELNLPLSLSSSILSSSIDGQMASLNWSYILTYVLLITSFFSLIIGTFVGLAQYKIKKLLAYSTISHIGFILLALSINTTQSIDSLLFYIIQYSLTNLNTFLIILAFGYLFKSKFYNLVHFKGNETDINFINEFTNKFWFNPLLSIALTISLFSMAGIPPLIGFFGKQLVLASALANGNYFMCFIGIFVSVISASYYLKIIKLLYVNPTNNKITNTNITNTNNTINLTNIHCFVISTLTLIILIFIINPSIILNSTQLLSLDLFNY